MTEWSPAAKARLAGGPIHAIAWNADCSAVAVSHGGSDVDIYEISSRGGNGLTFAKTASLSGHGQFVSGLDWSTRGDQLLSCSHDRNAFVWTRAAATASRAASGAAASTSGGGGGEPWEKQMVITRLTKGALCVKWSPSEAKFAIGSAARNVCVGYYDPESKWWACKLIRKAHESSVVAVAWHPNSLLLATGSTDRRVRLFNAYVRGYEPDAPAGALPEGSSFGDCLFEVAHDGCGWVHSVAFAFAAASSSGPADQQQLPPGAFPQLLYASHDFAVGAVDAGGGGAPAAAVAVRLPDAFLPLKCLAVVLPGRLAVGGSWSGGLAVLRNTGGGWQLAATLGTRDAAGGSGSGGGGAGGAGAAAAAGGGSSAVARQIAALNLNAVNMVPPGGAAGASGAGGSSAGAGGDQPGHGGALVTGVHVRPAAAWAAAGGGPRWHVASSGLDGQVLLWDLSAFL